ncbi:MAG TPA: indole-3-glycerol phosphate synthase TrpC [Pirellulaceae bacterium]|nr:indole-3-glycerol phosphate synthase TrpC [Pirellulaceae bacterium]
MTTILDKIVADKRLEIAERELYRPLPELVAAVANASPSRSFLNAIVSASPIALIAEVKRASPTQGTIRNNFDPVAAAKAYQRGGANCLSVLTDTPYFGGTLDDLVRVKQAIGLPVLRKDFVLSTYQVWESRAAGADAVLLIAECLNDAELFELHGLIVELGMTPLVELYEESNVERVLKLHPQLVGVNNRDLRTFNVDLEHTLRIRQAIPAHIPLVSESGIASPQDVERLIAYQVQAMLVGQSLMQSPDIEAATRMLLTGL